MTLEEIYYIGQTIAVIAILGSLGAIWVQLRKDHALARAEAQQTLLLHNSDMLSVLVNGPSTLESVQVCLIEYDTAPARQKAEFARFLHKSIAVAETAVYLEQDKLVAGNSHEKLVAWPALLLTTQGGLQFWEGVQIVYGKDVVAALDAYMRDHPGGLETVYAAAPFLRPDGPTTPKAIDGAGDEAKT